MANKVTWFEVVGKDGKKLQDFYSSLFDWKLEDPHGMGYGMVDASASGVGGGIGAAQEGPGHVTVYVEVDDLQAHLERAQNLGGKTVMPPMQVPNGPEIAMFSDPEGHVVGLLKAQSA